MFFREFMKFIDRKNNLMRIGGKIYGTTNYEIGSITFVQEFFIRVWITV